MLEDNCLILQNKKLLTTHNSKLINVDFAKLFTKGSWTSLGRYYVSNPSKLKELLVKAKKYASLDGLKSVKTEFLTICQYIGDVFTGRYKEYNILNLCVIVGAIVYVVTPIDILPDFIPAGFIDDTAIVVWAVHEFSDEIERYKQYKSRMANNKNGDASNIMDNIEEIEFKEIQPLNNTDNV